MNRKISPVTKLWLGIHPPGPEQITSTTMEDLRKMMGRIKNALIESKEEVRVRYGASGAENDGPPGPIPAPPRSPWRGGAFSHPFPRSGHRPTHPPDRHPSKMGSEKLKPVQGLTGVKLGRGGGDDRRNILPGPV